uniref:Reverse transcriptase domain-containing protein n=1 Tax=Amphimedon queenslandica TaxID=400682 RepID=A0A1X7TJF3_AMPQE
MWGLIKAYLSGRQQCVTVRGCQSGLLPVTSGVPQGSLLGPLFFILFINDLPGCTIHSNMLLFADDSKCSKSIASSSNCLLLQEDLDRVCEWSTSSGLKFNFQKTFLVRYRRKRAAPIVFNYCFGESTVPCNTSCKDLGIIFQEDLSWSAQVKAVLAKAYKTLSLLRRTFRAASTPTVVKKKLYLSLIIPIFTYCAPIWRPSLIKDILALEQFQRRATKYILNDYSSSYYSRLVALRILPLMYRLELVDVMFFVSSLKQPSPHFNILDYVSFCSSTTRSSSKWKLIHKSSPSSSVWHSFSWRFPRLWNHLPAVDLNDSLYVIKKED